MARSEADWLLIRKTFSGAHQPADIPDLGPDEPEPELPPPPAEGASEAEQLEYRRQKNLHTAWQRRANEREHNQRILVEMKERLATFGQPAATGDRAMARILLGDLAKYRGLSISYEEQEDLVVFAFTAIRLHEHER